MRFGPLMNVDGAAGGGGSGDGSDGAAPKSITLDDVNKAITGRLAEFAKKQETSIKTAIGSVATDIDKLLGEKLEAFRTSLPTPEAKTGDGAKPPAIHDTPEWKGLQKQLADTAAKVKAAEEREAAATAKSRDVSLRQKLASALADRKFDPARLRHAVGMLVDSEKRVRFADDGEDLVFKDIDGTEVDLVTGLDSWAKTDDAKIYLPPRGAAGSGDRGGGRRASGPGQKVEPTLEDLGNFVADAFPSFAGPRRG